MQELDGKVAVVTGGASGIGRAVARRLAREGMKLTLVDIELGPLEQVAAELEDAGTEVLISGGRGSELDKPGPELVIPLPAEEAQGITEIPGTRALQPGDPVRLTRPPYQGYAGTVIGAESRLTRYRSGVQCPAMWVQLSDGRRVHVPYTNLELMSA